MKIRGAGMMVGIALLSASAGAETLFDVGTTEVPGRPSYPKAVAGARGQPGVVVVSLLDGTPPAERRQLFVGRPGPGNVLESELFEVAHDVVAFDVGRGAAGPRVALLSGSELRWLDLDTGADQRRALPAGLPLPPRTRGLQPVEFLARAPDGTLTGDAFVPAIDGLYQVPLGPGEPIALELPVRAEYLENGEDVGLAENLLLARFSWPRAVLGFDDLDAKPEVYGLSRYTIRVFGDAPLRLLREIPLQPFTPEEEERWETTSQSLLVRDVDGDGLSDLVRNRTVGSLMASEATTEIFRNPGSGADPNGTPVTQLRTEGSLGSTVLIDLDGDGRLEALQILIPFSLLQAMRVLVTEQAEVHFRVLRFPGPGIGEPEPTWEGDVSLPIRFREGRMAGLLPTLAGDFDGDGRPDLLYGKEAGEVVLRRGVQGDRGPRFSGVVAEQEIPEVNRAAVADLDGDGLADLVAFDPRGAREIHWLHNRGSLDRRPKLEPISQ